MKVKILRFLDRSLYIICVCLAVVFFILNFLFTVTVSYDAAEKVYFHSHLAKSIVVVCLAAVFFLLLLVLKKYIVKINEKILFLIFSFVYIAAAIYFIVNIDPVLRADALEASNAAQALLNNNLDAFKGGGYLFKHPHQIGLMLFDSLLYLISSDIRIHFVVNLLFVLGINYVMYRTADLIFQDHLTNIFTIILIFAFLPQFFFIFFAYNVVPGLFLMILAFYNVLKFSKNHKWQNLFAAAAAAGAAVVLRKNFLIGVIAIVLFLILDLLKKYTYKHLTLIALLVIGALLPSNLLGNYFAEKADSPGESTPFILWLALGTDIDNYVRGPGWYDSSDYIIFESAKEDAEAAFEIGRQKLLDNINKIKKEPVRAAAFFIKKTISQWCEPRYQSIWSGPLEDCGQFTHTKLLQSIYNGEEAEDVLSAFLKWYMLVYWGLVVCFLVKRNRYFYGWQLVFIFLIGGFLFHTIWEAKSQYIYPYVFCVIPLAASALSGMLSRERASKFN